MIPVESGHDLGQRRERRQVAPIDVEVGEGAIDLAPHHRHVDLVNLGDLLMAEARRQRLEIALANGRLRGPARAAGGPLLCA